MEMLSKKEIGTAKVMASTTDAGFFAMQILSNDTKSLAL